MNHVNYNLLFSGLFGLGSSDKQSKLKQTSDQPTLYILKNSDNNCVEDQPTPPFHEFAIESFNEALDTLLNRSKPTDTIIFYIHGRAAGELPEAHKSLRTVMPCLEKDINAKVLMFYWPDAGKGGANGFPENEARTAGQALGLAILKFQQYKKTHVDKFLNRKTVLLSHSMGSLVFEEFVKKYQTPSLDKELFDTLLLSSSASATKDHAEWLEKVKISNDIYVTVNDNDFVLTAAGMKEKKGRLGKKLETLIAGEITLTSNAKYVNLDKSGVEGHRIFIGKNLKNNPNVDKFFENVLSGHTIDLNGFPGIKDIKSRDGTNIYFF